MASVPLPKTGALGDRVVAPNKAPPTVPEPRLLLRKRLDERARARADRETASQREHDTDMIERRVAAAWPVDGPRRVKVNDAQAVRMESRAALVDLLATLAWSMPTHLVVVLDDVDVIFIAGGELYFAYRLARVLPAARKIVAAQDLARLGSLCAFVEYVLYLPCAMGRHRIFLSDGVTEVECRVRSILLRFILTVLDAVRAYLAAPKAPSAKGMTQASGSPVCMPCPVPGGTSWPRVFAAHLLGSGARTVTLSGITYEKEAVDVWVRRAAYAVALLPAAAADRLADDYCMWGGPIAVGASFVRDPVIDWAVDLYLCVRIEGACLWAIERALTEAIACCPPAYLMHGAFRAMLDCVGLVEASPRIRHHVIAPTVLTNMVA
ncbi:hypothetical protein TW95_gp0217 [Pandoravirus inopinatum]|uniref:Uncharacterized protein n=1 Tax=Pandoravirus inopinatum TaxID=1605721 RepID=A0A0B5J834_9VIRU|nr:hypothetical protein TW95_gp0217 [Pandoravirus inopinatum]AJF96951.1 hypothetical protein [Pandoravirus inopinatum]